MSLNLKSLLLESIEEGPEKKKGRIFIPKEFEFPAELRGEHFKLLKQGNKYALLVSPLAKVALEAIERGRTTFEKEQDLFALTRLLKDKLPGGVRGIIKKGIATSRIDSASGMIPVNVEILRVDENGNFFIKNPFYAAVTYAITDKGKDVLRALKAGNQPEIALDNTEIITLVKVFKGESTESKALGTLEQKELIKGTKEDKATLQNPMYEEEIDEMSTTGTGATVTSGTGEGVATKYAFGKRKNKGTPSNWKDAPSIPNRPSKVIDYKQLYQESYAQFRNTTKTRTKPEQFHQAVKSVRQKVKEINQLFEYMERLRMELSEGEGLKYRKYTENAIFNIKEMVKALQMKSKKLK